MMKFLLVLLLFCVYGCTVAEVKVEMVSERTVLENQVLGTYNALDDEMLLVASVRGVDPKGNIKKPKKHSGEHNDAVAAMQLQDFHVDDIRNFKTLGWVGEDKLGLIHAFQMDKENVSDDLKEFAERYSPDEFNTVVSQVNEARHVIMQRVIEMNENLSSEDMKNVQRIFGRLNAENALKGEKIQVADGTWTVKK